VNKCKNRMDDYYASIASRVHHRQVQVSSRISANSVISVTPTYSRKTAIGNLQNAKRESSNG